MSFKILGCTAAGIGLITFSIKIVNLIIPMYIPVYIHILVTAYFVLLVLVLVLVLVLLCLCYNRLTQKSTSNNGEIPCAGHPQKQRLISQIMIERKEMNKSYCKGCYNGEEHEGCEKHLDREDSSQQLMTPPMSRMTSTKTTENKLLSMDSENDNSFGFGAKADTDQEEVSHLDSGYLSTQSGSGSFESMKLKVPLPETLDSTNAHSEQEGILEGKNDKILQDSEPPGIHPHPQSEETMQIQMDTNKQATSDRLPSKDQPKPIINEILRQTAIQSQTSPNLQAPVAESVTENNICQQNTAIRNKGFLQTENPSPEMSASDECSLLTASSISPDSAATDIKMKANTGRKEQPQHNTLSSSDFVQSSTSRLLQCTEKNANGKRNERNKEEPDSKPFGGARKMVRTFNQGKPSPNSKETLSRPTLQQHHASPQRKQQQSGSRQYLKTVDNNTDSGDNGSNVYGHATGEHKPTGDKHIGLFLQDDASACAPSYHSEIVHREARVRNRIVESRSTIGQAILQARGRPRPEFLDPANLQQGANIQQRQVYRPGARLPDVVKESLLSLQSSTEPDVTNHNQ